MMPELVTPKALVGLTSHNHPLGDDPHVSDDLQGCGKPREVLHCNAHSWHPVTDDSLQRSPKEHSKISPNSVVKLYL